MFRLSSYSYFTRALLLVALLALFSCGGGTSGSDDGRLTRLSGVLRETDGNAIPNALVIIEETGETIITGPSGEFSVEIQLPAGDLTFLIESDEFSTSSTIENIPEQAESISVELKVDAETNSSEVESSKITEREREIPAEMKEPVFRSFAFELNIKGLGIMALSSNTRLMYAPNSSSFSLKGDTATAAFRIAHDSERSDIIMPFQHAFKKTDGTPLLFNSPPSTVSRYELDATIYVTEQGASAEPFTPIFVITDERISGDNLESLNPSFGRQGLNARRPAGSRRPDEGLQLQLNTDTSLALRYQLGRNAPNSISAGAGVNQRLFQLSPFERVPSVLPVIVSSGQLITTVPLNNLGPAPRKLAVELRILSRDLLIEIESISDFQQ